jgi:hypothetical protein
MKPQLPIEIEAVFPSHIVGLILTFVPHLPRPKKPSPKFSSIANSPQFEKDMRLIQYSTIKGKSGMWLRDLDDFLLDKFDI